MAKENETKLGPLIRFYDSIGKTIDMLNQGDCELRISGVGLSGPLKGEVCFNILQDSTVSDKLEELLLAAQKQARQDIKDFLDKDF